MSRRSQSRYHPHQANSCQRSILHETIEKELNALNDLGVVLIFPAQDEKLEL